MDIDARNIEVLDDEMAEVFRKKTPQQRLVIAFKLWDSARTQLINHLKTTNPGWDDAKIQAEAARRLSHGAV